MDTVKRVEAYNTRMESKIRFLQIHSEVGLDIYWGRDGTCFNVKEIFAMECVTVGTVGSGMVTARYVGEVGCELVL